ncbi:MAG: carbon-nitrogen hydrolase family protein [Pseudomonadota bacterium]
MTNTDTIRLCAVQAAPALFDKSASLQIALDWIDKAAAEKPDLIAFGEAWLPGYPFFIDSPLSDTWWQAASELLANGVLLDGPEVQALCKAAKRAQADLVIGINELDKQTQGTLYCTMLTISRDGKVVNRHRKIKPTHHERSVWGDGDAKGLKPVQTGWGRLSALNCWEHNAVLPAYAMMAQGVDVHVAAWPGREPETVPDGPVWARQLLLSRAFASQAGAWVICAAGLRMKQHVPQRFQQLYEFDHNGGAAIIDPRGELVTEILRNEEGLLVTNADLSLARACKVASDPAGHYSRPDLFRLEVDGREIYPGDRG